MQVRECPRCHKPFECNADDIAGCRCGTADVLPATISVLRKTYTSCLCVDCLEDLNSKFEAIDGDKFPEPGSLILNDHFYVENGLFVFTEKYHLLRGHCCQSGCRHCPYEFRQTL